MSTRDSPGGKGGRCVRLTTYHPCSAERQEIRWLNLPGPPWAISTSCCRRDLYLYLTTATGCETNYSWVIYHISSTKIHFRINYVMFSNLTLTNHRSAGWSFIQCNSHSECQCFPPYSGLYSVLPVILQTKREAATVSLYLHITFCQC